MTKPETKSKYKGTLVAFHGCDHAYQDAKYGAHMRVFNHAPGNDYKLSERFRCSVCGREK